jgi:hypothetical protein
LLALPGIWLAWSVLAFLVAIMAFVWRTGARGETHPALLWTQEFGPRVAITCQLLLGLVYLALVIRDDALGRARESEEGARDRGRNRATDSLGLNEKPLPTNELGLSGMERKQEAPATGNGDIAISDSYSALGL